MGRGPIPVLINSSKTSMKAILLLSALAIGACAAPLPESTSDRLSVNAELPPPLALGSGDVLQVVVHGRPEFSAESGMRITSGGTVVLPIAGPVQVAGLTVEAAGVAIEEALGEFLRNPKVGITVQEPGAHRFHVLGHVDKPGAFVMDRPITALEALATAQGLRPGAMREKVALLRRHGLDEVEIHFFNADTPDAAGLVFLRPGDLVFVTRSGTGVFNDEILPVLQGIGFTTNQVVALAVAQDAL
ncbi:MAG: polysaccharide export outer membrane protein [Chlamydiales bacterium]